MAEETQEELQTVETDASLTNADTDETETETETEKGDAGITQAELEQIVQEAKEQAKSEAEKLAQMSDDEKTQKELNDAKAELAKLKAEKAEVELTGAVKDILDESGLPLSLTSTLVGVGDAENIKAIVKELNQVVSDKVEERVGTTSPKNAATKVGTDVYTPGGVLGFAQAIDKAAKTK